ncbi:phosphoribosyltransferase-like protein [Parapusillimonas granuli]|uniref:Uncharacterized protein n=1 Tax=Parapusillimonas granuli TaxID=380911 RepID=A0A853G3Y4_9BURK|nr:hypothetical protein [Parapusillimonas granuli]MBB5217187.1 hypothetical protein [Parapusillimonas granuli]NYT51019.1 hypothetical protein [Parapusillimonas granuli]
MSSGPVSARHLLLTARGEQWLNNFDEADRPIARDLTASLTLVSHNEFERGLISLVHQVAHELRGPIGLYGVREIDDSVCLDTADNTTSIDATPRGADIGSEGRLANVIRNLSLGHPSQFLNHPSIEELRARRVATILVLDDFVGSGQRCSNYLSALWKSRSLRSWRSYNRIQFKAIAYSATAMGIRHVQRHPSQPLIHIVRHCPTITALHWKDTYINDAKKFCRHYAHQAKLGRWALGFRDSESLLVFEHGCPNNAPAIFWAISRNTPTWIPLFPSRRVDISVSTAFPNEIARRDPVHTLIEAGQRRLASALSSNAHRPLTDQEALTLALFSKGKNRVTTVANATGLSAKEAIELIERCISAGWISAHQRITDRGMTELRGIRQSSTHRVHRLPDLGKEEYYPTALKSHGNG